MPYILPEEGKFNETAVLLLELANDPRDVATSTEGERLGFVVPDDLYERYQKAGKKKAKSGKSDAEE